MADNYGRANARALKGLNKIMQKVNEREAWAAALSDAELPRQTTEFKARLERGETLDELLPDAFAVCREAAKRVLRMRHYDVQIIGGIALHQGRVCQMATGEGKTLVATLPAYLNALTGKGVHIVTVNDYLAKRDAEWMGKIYKFLGLSVGVVYAMQPVQTKIDAYNSDITYGTNNEYGFDYLRDNMETSAEARKQRMLNFAIIDEVDSILIDEARTPLILSGRGAKSSQMYIQANRFAKTLVKDKDYEIDEKDREAQLLDPGIEKAERFFNVENLADLENSELNHYILRAVKAHTIMRRDKDYIVEKGEIIIVDEFTGRKMLGRRYSAGLHQAIEAKENVPIKEEHRTMATITLQNYFRLYKKISGMTGTAKTVEDEFNAIYNLDVVVVPTNLPCRRADENDKIYTTREGKLRNAAAEIKERHGRGQPILIGTVTVEKSEELSEILSKMGVPHNVLNAKNHAREAEIVAQAGRLGAVTIATNMAGRGTDILLGGNPEFMAKQEMLRQGFTEEQISVATSYAEGDMETERLKGVFRDLHEKHKQTTQAEKEKVIAAGGLHILGTERHDSRRIDDQLRGRAARQGDVGSSVFYLSTQDDMVRIFAGERMENVLKIFNFDADTPITAKILTRQIESAQRMIEGRHFSARKRVLQFDDVNNLQRNTIYKSRNAVLEGEDVHAKILSFAKTYARKALEDACGGVDKAERWNAEQINAVLSSKYLPPNAEGETADFLTPQMCQNHSAKEIMLKLAAHVEALLEQKSKEGEELGMPFAGFERYVLLRVTDEKWMDHIDDMENLRQSVGLQAIGQHDPISVYKQEGYNLFEKMQDEIQTQTVRVLLFAQAKRISAPRVKVASAAAPKVEIKDGETVAFNSPCPCGSGKKYKNCCGEKAAAEQKEKWRLERKGK